MDSCLDKRVILKANSINLIAIFITFNYFILHHIATKTFSPLAFILDSGWASTWTIVFILAGQAGTLWLLLNAKSRREVKDWSLLMFIYQVYCFREADLHKFPEEWPNITNMKFYTASAAPIELKVIILAVFILFALSVIYLLTQYTLRLFPLLLKGEPFAVSFCLWGTYIFFSQVLDRIDFFNSNPIPIVKNIEEMMELTAALFALLTIAQYIRHKVQTERAVQ